MPLYEWVCPRCSSKEQFHSLSLKDAPQRPSEEVRICPSCKCRMEFQWGVIPLWLYQPGRGPVFQYAHVLDEHKRRLRETPAQRAERYKDVSDRRKWERDKKEGRGKTIFTV